MLSFRGHFFSGFQPNIAIGLQSSGFVIVCRLFVCRLSSSMIRVYCDETTANAVFLKSRQMSQTFSLVSLTTKFVEVPSIGGFRLESGGFRLLRDAVSWTRCRGSLGLSP